MAVPRRPPMPKVAPFALAERAAPRKKRPLFLIVFFLLFAAPLFIIHLPLLGLPLFWDELGQFIPTALDLFRHGWWVARSTIPNIHPPAVEAYLAVWYTIFGFSIPVTRVAMLLIAASGLLLTFLLAIELSKGSRGAPAFLPPLLLLASPLFYTQSMMAQLDMPAMTLTLLSLLLFLKEEYIGAAAVSVLLVLTKETALVAPALFATALLIRRDWKRAAYFGAPAAALAAWLVVLHRATGYWLGDPGFAHYNVAYALHPVRIALSLARRIYYLFFAEFRWIGTVALLFAWRDPIFRTYAWRITGSVALVTMLLVSLLGGAELERYILPVLPVFYIAVSVACSSLPKRANLPISAALLAGLVCNLFWNPPYPFPYENNYAMVDFVRLQKAAAYFAEVYLRNSRIATAWPYTAALRNPDYGFVDSTLRVVETHDFHVASIDALSPDSFDALITYTRTWAPDEGIIRIPLIRSFLTRFYDWQPDITPSQCESLGLRAASSWQLRDQKIIVYVRTGPPATKTASRF